MSGIWCERHSEPQESIGVGDYGFSGEELWYLSSWGGEHRVPHLVWPILDELANLADKALYCRDCILQFSPS